MCVCIPDTAAGYSLVHVQGDMPECEGLDCLRVLLGQLEPHVAVVGPSVLASLSGGAPDFWGEHVNL